MGKYNMFSRIIKALFINIFRFFSVFCRMRIRALADGNRILSNHETHETHDKDFIGGAGAYAHARQKTGVKNGENGGNGD